MSKAIDSFSASVLAAIDPERIEEFARAAQELEVTRFEKFKQAIEAGIFLGSAKAFLMLNNQLGDSLNKAQATILLIDEKSIGATNEQIKFLQEVREPIFEYIKGYKAQLCDVVKHSLSMEFGMPTEFIGVKAVPDDEACVKLGMFLTLQQPMWFAGWALHGTDNIKCKCRNCLEEAMEKAGQEPSDAVKALAEKYGEPDERPLIEFTKFALGWVNQQYDKATTYTEFPSESVDPSTAGKQTNDLLSRIIGRTN